MRRADDATAVIDTFLISCRVLGRQLEAVMVNRMARLARAMGARDLVGEYIPTARNAQVADLYPRLGFEAAEAGPEGERWRWSLAAGDPAIPDWFEIAELEGVGA